MAKESDFKKFYLPNLRVLVGCAAFGGIAVGTMGLFAYRKIQRTMQALPFHNHAITLLKSNSMAMELIGTPIELLGVDAGDRRHNYVDPDGNGRLKIPLKGRKLAGDLFVWASLLKSSEWVVDRLEFKTSEKEKPKIFIVYDRKVHREMQPTVRLDLD